MKPDPSERCDELPDLEAAATRVEELEETVGQLKQAITSHADLDQAIGVIVVVGTLTPAEAWDVLREIPMHTNTRLHLVAGLIVAWGHGADLPEEIRSELDHLLRSGAVESAPSRADGFAKSLEFASAD
ncbi:ANTAR domain-containing protein [Streptomyces sp. NPDC102364]|uniref:ANTAR domain-containing protein n=1 Tax=Streptomyces sp. NPDC102364 TaxID=3366161 RepID=UPI00382603DC